MRLPPNFARDRVMGHHNNGTNPAKGWRVQVADKAVFISCQAIRRPHGFRDLIEKVLKLKPKPQKTEEEKIVMRSRQSAALKRRVRNKLASGADMTMPWEFGRRRLDDIKREERLLEIAVKWTRMGEYRR